MAKRKKAGTKAATARRTTRRGKQAAQLDGESSSAPEPSASDNANQEPPSDPPPPLETTEPQNPETSTKPVLIPVVALHKKFGKYRCLFNNDETFVRKYEVGSDSETNSSVEIKVVDPCASSESDSNAMDTHSDTTVCNSPINSNISTIQINSRDMSPVPISRDSTSCIEIPFLTDNQIELPPKPTLDYIEEVEENKVEVELPQETPQLEREGPMAIEDDIEISQEEVNQDIPLTEEQEYADDDEIITVVQIVEDDNQELYYDIKIDSPKGSEHNEENTEDKTQENDIRKHFESLQLASTIETRSPLECTEIIDLNTPPCGTPDPAFHNDNLMRPDPSITPSSTLSDDSNSSRAAEHTQNNSNDSAESSPTGVRRSTRIKTISNLKQKTKGYGLVKTPLKKALITQTKLKLEELGSDSQEKSTDMLLTTPNSPSFPIPSEMPVKVKSRWRRSSELEMGASSPASSPLASPNLPQKLPSVPENIPEEPTVVPLSKEAYDKIIEDRMNQYHHLEENDYLCERMISKDTKKMICDCFMTKDELERGELACGEDCLNRLLMIECNSRCPVGDRCTNRRFQKRENASLKVFYADKKGCGVEAGADLSTGEFLMEYVGEVLDYEQFYKRAQAYSDENNMHHYFMSLKGDTVIDATLKGNISRFINHSCDPNAETQKWTVNGELRIGFFSKREIPAGEEITFDYQFQRFGKVAQRCYCGADNCRGWIGAEPDSDDEDYEEEEEDVSTSKSGAAELPEGAAVAAAAAPKHKPRRAKKDRKYKPKTPDLVQDADIEEDLEALSRTGVKNQSHTLRLSRTVVRAKSVFAQTALLRLLRDSDLPCRRLFLDYRGLRLLAPWCNDASLEFKWEMLQTVDRLPIPNKTMVQESRFFTIVERWLTAADAAAAEPVFIDESTGLPVNIPNRDNQENATSPEKSKDTAAMLEKVKELSKQLLERWSSLKEVFKIPKKERIQQMKEHERQANVERRAADSSGTRDRDRDRRETRDREREREREREKDRERERERDRDRDRDRERDRDRYRDRDNRERDRDRDRDRDDRDRRKRRSPDGRRSIRLTDRVLAAVPPMSKEERRRAFAEAAAAADDQRRQQLACAHYWPNEHYPQMFPPGMMSGPGNMPMMMPGNMPNMPNMPNMMGGMMPGMPQGMPPGMPPADMPPEWLAEYQNGPPFCPPFQPPQPFCMPQPNMMGMSGYGMSGFMFGQQMQPPGAFPPPLQQPHTEIQQPSTNAAGEVLIPRGWRSARDARGRVYYYHVKLRQPQWLPPPLPPEDDTSSEEEEDQANTVDSPVVRTPSKGKFVEGVNGIYEVIKEDVNNGLIPDHALLSVKPRKRRPGLVSERPISPRTEEDKLAGRLEVKRYKQTKEKLRRRKEKLMQKVRLLAASKKSKLKGFDADAKMMVDLVDSATDSDDEEEEANEKISPTVESPVIIQPVAEGTALNSASVEAEARRVKEQFRSNMARVMVQHLNPYRHRAATAGRITCTADFKHLARKLTHFVMLKELKHCRSVDELVVTDSVRAKAKMFVKKYMAKFGPVYKRPAEEAD